MADNYFDQYDETEPADSGGGGNYFDQYDPPTQTASSQQPDRGNYFDQFDAPQQSDQQPRAESAFGSALRGAAHTVLPAIAAVPGFIGGAALATPTGPIGSFFGGLAGGAAAYGAASKVQESALKTLGFDDSQQQAANAATHPYAQMIGEVVGAAPTFGVEAAAPLATRAIGAAIGGGFEAASQVGQGEGFDPGRLAIAAAGGALLTKPTAVAETLGGRTAAAIGRPDLWHGTAAPTAANDATAHPPPVDQAVGDPQNKATRSETDYGKATAAQPSAKQPITNTDPALDAAIRAKMAPEGEPFSPVPATAASAKQSNVIPFDEPFVPRGKGDYVPPEVDMSPEAVAKRAKSDEMTARFAREREEETAWRHTQRGQEEQPPGPAGAAAEPEIPTATSAKLEAQFPRVAPGVEGRPLTGEPAAPVQSAQPPAAAQAAIANSKGFSVRWNPDEFQFEAVSKDGKVIGHLLDAMPEKGTPENPAFTAGAEVDEPWRRKGVASALYDAFAAKHDGNIAPAGNTSREAWDFWLKKYPDKTADYVKQQAADIAANARSGNFDPEAFTDQSIRNNYDHPKIQDMIIKELRSATPAAPSVAAEQQAQPLTPRKAIEQRAPGETVGEAMRRQVLERGRSGRPIETEPLPIGTEPAILEKGMERATGPRPEAAPAPPGPPPGGTPPPEAPPPLGGVPPGQRPAPAPPARFPFLSKLLRAWQETFQPETISSNALRAEPVFAKMKSAQSGEHDRIFHETQEGEARWNKIPEADRFSFLSDVENGRTVKPEVKADAQHIRRMLDEADKLEKQWGSKAAYRDDYFPHEWEAPRPGQPPLMEYLTHTLGQTGFQKARTIDLIEQGIAGGYKLKNTNPYAAVRSRLLAGADMRMTMEMLGGLEKMQLAGKVKNDAQAATLAKQGWQKVNAPDREQWLVSPEIQPIWNNVVAQRGLWGDPGVAGDVFRGWMQFKSAWVPIKLAVSAFHPLHVAHINMSSNLARAADQAIAGDINGAIKSAKQAVTTTFRPAAEVGGKPITAKEVQNQWLLGENARTPEGKLAVQYMEEGGIIPRAPEQFRSAAAQRLNEAWQAMNPFKLAYYAPQELVRRIQAPIFDVWIPRLKVASYLNDAAALMKRRPDLVNNDEARGIALRALGKSIDNRYGEMFYNGLFWNKMAKDLGTGSLLSLGWNLGFAREFGGAAIEAATRPAGKFIPGMAPSAERQTIRDATNKIKFASIYMGTAAMIGGIMTKMFTGENPQDTNDYIFPRVGGLNPDGSPRRLTTMFYLREIPMLEKHVQEQGGGFGGMLGGAMSMLWNKTLLQPIRELVENRDYFGREVWDTNAPGYQAIAQAVRHTFGQQFSPMSVTSAERAQETGGRPIETPLAFLGFGPAPAYAARTPIQNRIGYLYQNYVAPGSKPYQDDAVTHDQQVARNQILLAKQNKDEAALSAARAAALKAGMKPRSIANIGKEAGDQYMFQRLPQQHQMAILNQAAPDEIPRYLPHASAATKRQWNAEHQAAAVQ